MSTRHLQHGLTLVEMMVSIALALLVTLAALGVLLFSRQGGTAMEQSTALRDNARFGTELVRRIVMQTGFESPLLSTGKRQSFSSATPSDPAGKADVGGADNAMVPAATDPSAVASGNRKSDCGTLTDTRCKNGSDVLIVRYQGTDDGSMINCAGVAEGDATTADGRSASAFHVRISAAGEPTLTCTYRRAGSWQDVELLEGVESFQVLYGTDGVEAGKPSTSADPPSRITTYLRADQMTVAGDAVKTQANWRRVRAIRIGMVLRGTPGSAISNVARDLYPLGQAMHNTDDALSKFPVPLDGRLRQEVTFTVLLRNYQGLQGNE